MLDTQAALDTAVESLTIAAAAYYDSSEEVMTDAAYDDLLGQVEAALAEHPEWSTDKSRALLDAVAAGASAGGDITHPSPMLSLTKATTLDEVRRFIDKVGDPAAVICEPKLDGLAVRVVYRHGTLTQIVTRGDGTTGEDISNPDRTITGLPARLPLDAPQSIELRGEVYMTDEDFTAANAIRLADGDEPFKNSRNAVAGAIRRGDVRIPMRFAAYDHTNPDVTLHTRRLQELSAMGIVTSQSLLDTWMLTGDPIETIERFGIERSTYPFPTDGIVITANSDTDRDRLGVASRAPRYALAYKYEAETATTVVRDIELSLGRTGRLALRAKVDPTLVAGTTITYASLHNVGWLTEQDIRIGDTVIVKRANDVIPRVESPDLSKRPADAARWEPPTVCPQCGEPFDKTTELWRCTTAECSVLGRIVYAASRDALDIEGLSTAIAAALVEQGLVSTVADLFTLADNAASDATWMDRVVNLPLGQTSTGGVRRLGELNATKILNEISAAKAQPLNRVITALGLRQTGRTMSRRLAAHFGSMDALLDASVEDLCAVEGVALGKAQIIHSELRLMEPVIRVMADHHGVGRVANAGADSGSTAAALDGMNIVVTGKVTGPLAGLSRNEMNELIEANGGKASGSVTSKTSLLVCAEPGSSKHTKALDLGVRIVTPEEFADLLSPNT